MYHLKHFKSVKYRALYTKMQRNINISTVKW